MIRTNAAIIVGRTNYLLSEVPHLLEKPGRGALRIAAYVSKCGL
jgi:hypothetical protein